MYYSGYITKAQYKTLKGHSKRMYDKTNCDIIINWLLKKNDVHIDAILQCCNVIEYDMWYIAHNAVTYSTVDEYLSSL